MFFNFKHAAAHYVSSSQFEGHIVVNPVSLQLTPGFCPPRQKPAFTNVGIHQKA